MSRTIFSSNTWPTLSNAANIRMRESFFMICSFLLSSRRKSRHQASLGTHDHGNFNSAAPIAASHQQRRQQQQDRLHSVPPPLDLFISKGGVEQACRMLLSAVIDPGEAEHAPQLIGRHILDRYGAGAFACFRYGKRG